MLDILINGTGHIKLTDFGTAALCSDNQSPRTSFVGTQDYVSPEVLVGEKTATKACDLWAVGCMIFQMITGKSPFREATEFLTFEAIMGHCRNDKPLHYPSSITPDAHSLILLFLKPDENERLGAGDESSNNGYFAVKSHPFFVGIDWENLLNITPPFQPNPATFPSSEGMKDGATNDWLLDGDPTPITPYHRISDAVQHNHVVSDENKIWNRFLRDGENQVFTSVVYKRVVSYLL
jgi:3-phosphoinositide dependent protein kinase-1